MSDDWIEFQSKSQNKPYWYNKLTKETTWIKPNNTNLINNDVDYNIKTKRQKLDKVKVAVIVPFRDITSDKQRTNQLNRFINDIPEFFNRNDVQSTIKLIIYIIEQKLDDKKKFNRGKLLNIGYEIASKENNNIFIFHDVDLIPSDDLFEYYSTIPSTNPIHIAKVWGRYSSNPKYVGGIISFSKDLFIAINGFPNNFWGWGGEDDEMYKRLNTLDIKTIEPTKGNISDMENMTLDNKIELLRKNRSLKCMNKFELLNEHKSTWQTNGLSNLLYKEISRDQLNQYTIKITVDLLINYHWSDKVCGDNDDLPTSES